ncbi:hypothetical protein SAMN04488096_101423 [Mesonia phycicola]|uniref:Esterase n=1 Tax=Mesonia phycicola TaxID=579105 RepID=A0A1M6ASE8_9FLAO|nr:alpha/beta hydrolase-fold protein [Mesonia phycicola]SHI39392.1 hypothetical protein SAMN04488096_101423 [Mesonia phycicola]
MKNFAQEKLPQKISTILFIIFTIILSHHSVLAQEKIKIGEKVILHSKKLNENRELYISLPKSYNNNIYSKKNYPVLYFFDGDSHFENLVAQRNWLTRNLYATMPEIILVGILQKDRTNELTPTHMETPEGWKRANFSTSGGNQKFMSFIEEEVKTFVDKNYRTNGFEILSGHSFGGLSTVNCFINTPELYNAYIAIDPSIWWDNTTVLNNLEENCVTKKHQNKLLFIAKANDAGSGEEHHQAILAFHDILKNLATPTNFNWQFKLYENEDHGSVVVPAEYDAYRFIFEGYQLPVKKAMKNPQLIDTHYQKISSRLGYAIIPDEALIDQLANVCIKQGLYTQAEKLLLKNSKNYPQSKSAQSKYKKYQKEKLNK